MDVELFMLFNFAFVADVSIHRWCRAGIKHFIKKVPSDVKAKFLCQMWVAIRGITPALNTLLTASNARAQNLGHFWPERKKN